jgi:hypothetical protein
MEEQAQESRVNIPLLAFGIVGLIAVTRALYNLNVGARALASEGATPDSLINADSTPYEVSGGSSLEAEQG